jgi:hypothetical protein
VRHFPPQPIKFFHSGCVVDLRRLEARSSPHPHTAQRRLYPAAPPIQPPCNCHSR